MNAKQIIAQIDEIWGHYFDDKEDGKPISMTPEHIKRWDALTTKLAQLGPEWKWIAITWSRRLRKLKEYSKGCRKDN